jgi:hypothetical protein
MKLEVSRQIFEKYSNIRFYGNPYSGSRARRTDERTNMTKLIVHCYDFHLNAPEMKLVYVYKILQSEEVIRCILQYDMSKLIFGHTIRTDFSTYYSTHVGPAEQIQGIVGMRGQ